MRLRNIKGAREMMVESDHTVNEPQANKGRWRKFFGNGNPIHLEIGTGKGNFIMTMAQSHPEISFIGIEKYSSVLLRALEKQQELMLPNVFFIRTEAENIEDIFEEGEIDRIYLNFSDPWPKDRHAKRRLTSKQFLARYDIILKKDGEVEFKTDNRALFDFSVEEAREAGWQLRQITYDLHNSEMNEGNVMTEYEIRFSEQGTPINKFIAFR